MFEMDDDDPLVRVTAEDIFGSAPRPTPLMPTTPPRPPEALVESWGWQTTKAGARHSNLHNLQIAFDHDPVLQRLAHYDAFLDRILTDQPAREWTDADDVRWALYVQDHYRLISVSPSLVHDLIAHRARAKTTHAVKDWLSAVRWDGVPRIETALEDYWQVPIGQDQPEDYIRAVSRNLFVGMVARVLRPGCQLDTMIVFEGAQGIGKTSALRILGGPWYALASESVTTRDFFEGLQGKWLIEIGELDAFSRAEVTRVKTAISTPVDRYRAPYARTAEDRPRQCVFCGTTNADDWGHDETGLRRFWPVRCGPVQLALLESARPQLFAEAVVALEGGATWWEVPDTAKAVQSDRQAEHPWAKIILDWLTTRQEATTAEVLTEALKMPAGQIQARHEREIGRVLKLAGWSKRNLRRDGKQRKIWVSPTWDLLVE